MFFAGVGEFRAGSDRTCAGRANLRFEVFLYLGGGNFLFNRCFRGVWGAFWGIGGVSDGVGEARSVLSSKEGFRRVSTCPEH